MPSNGFVQHREQLVAGQRIGIPRLSKEKAELGLAGALQSGALQSGGFSWLHIALKWHSKAKKRIGKGNQGCETALLLAAMAETVLPSNGIAQ